MADIKLNHGDHLDAFEARRGILIVTSRDYPATNRRQRLLRRLLVRFL